MPIAPSEAVRLGAATPRRIGIAGIQMHVARNEDNIPRMAQLVAQTKHRFPWIDIILFPELCVFGSDPHRAQPLPGEALGRLSQIARQHALWLVPGSLYEAVEGVVYNSTPVIGPDGTLVAIYRKMFPFRPYEIGVEAGTSFVIFDIPGLTRVGTSICYDMWFQETTRTLVAMGAEIILHPTLTDTIDREIELSIARASAATNQCYFFDINGVGDGGVGRSLVVDPSGYVLHEGGQAQEIIPILVDLDRVHLERQNGLRSLGQPLKSFRDRRVEFTIYDRSRFAASYLETLGPLVKPRSALFAALTTTTHGEETDVAAGVHGSSAQEEKA
jgi:predicted amidohydrolase